MTDTGAAARRARRILQVIVVLALWGLITHGTFAGTGDEPHYLAIAHSLAFDGDLDLANNYGANEPLILGGSLKEEAHVQIGVGGVARPVHDIGLPLLFAPIVRIVVPIARTLVKIVPARAMQRARLTPSVLYRHLISMVMIGFAAVLAGLMFDTFLRIGGSTRAAFGSALLLALSPPLLIFSVLFFTELLSALLCLIVFRRLVLPEGSDGPAKAGHYIGAAAWLLTGTATGLLFLLHAKNIGLVVPFVTLAFQRLRRRGTRREALAFVLGVSAMIGIRTAINYRFWGSLVTGPHAQLSGVADWSQAVREPGIRLAGLLIDQEFGLLIYAPVYVLAITGLIALSKQQGDLARQILHVVAFYVMLIILPITNVHGWTGGWNPAARFLTPVVPLLGLAAFAGMRTARLVILTIVVVVQILIDAYAWQHPKILWNDGDGRAAFCDVLGERACRYLPSLAASKR